MSVIAALRAREILDSRGNPTLEVDCQLEGGALGRAAVPSGASTGQHEAIELRDGEAARFRGKGVQRAVRNVNEVLAPALLGSDPFDQGRLDGTLVALDGTPNTGRHAANGLPGVARPAAQDAAGDAAR